jgi:hypothetical protein
VLCSGEDRERPWDDRTRSSESELTCLHSPFRPVIRSRDSWAASRSIICDRGEERHYFHFEHNRGVIQFPSIRAFGVKRADQSKKRTLESIEKLRDSAERYPFHDTTVTRIDESELPCAMVAWRRASGSCRYPRGFLGYGTAEA